MRHFHLRIDQDSERYGTDALHLRNAAMPDFSIEYVRIIDSVLLHEGRNFVCIAVEADSDDREFVGIFVTG